MSTVFAPAKNPKLVPPMNMYILTDELYFSILSRWSANSVAKRERARRLSADVTHFHARTHNVLAFPSIHPSIHPHTHTAPTVFHSPSTPHPQHTYPPPFPPSLDLPVTHPTTQWPPSLSILNLLILFHPSCVLSLEASSPNHHQEFPFPPTLFCSFLFTLLLSGVWICRFSSTPAESPRRGEKMEDLTWDLWE